MIDVDASTVRAAPPPAGAGFWIAFAIGAGIMAFGIRGALMELEDSATDVARWVVGADLVHDFVLAPLVVAVGWCTNRLVPRRLRAPVQAGLVATGVVLLLGWPAWRGYGRHVVPDNPSVQPLDYATAILTVLAVVWAAVLVWAAVRVLSGLGSSGRASRRTRPDPPGDRR